MRKLRKRSRTDSWVVLHQKGLAYKKDMKIRQALRAFEDSSRASEEVPDPTGVAANNCEIGKLYVRAHEFEIGERLLMSAYDFCRRNDNIAAVPACLQGLIELSLLKGDSSEARRLAEEAKRIISTLAEITSSEEDSSVFDAYLRLIDESGAYIVVHPIDYRKALGLQIEGWVSPSPIFREL